MYYPKLLKIAKIEQEAKGIRTYWFDYNLKAKPGQFVMLWLPELEQKPFSIAYSDENKFALTIAAVGSLSKKLAKAKVGDEVGVWGPLGTHYKLPSKQKVAMVAGGYGAAPLYFATLEALKKGCQVDFLIGARNKDLLLYTKKIKQSQAKLHIATDDGSAGTKGFVTKLLEELCQKNKPDLILACGPELMEYNVFKLAEQKKIPSQISIERYMKCGIGVCGSCSVDPLGIRMCMEGPVVDHKVVRKVTEFGKYYRDGSGKKVYYVKNS